MGKFNYVITDEVGIHARPAGVLAKLVKSLDSVVTIKKGDKTVDASKLMAVMSLGVKKGEEVEVASESEKDLETVKKFFQENL